MLVLAQQGQPPGGQEPCSQHGCLWDVRSGRAWAGRQSVGRGGAWAGRQRCFSGISLPESSFSDRKTFLCRRERTVYV